MKAVLSDYIKQKIREYFEDHYQIYGVKITPTLKKVRFMPTKIMLKIEFVNQNQEVISTLTDQEIAEECSLTIDFEHVISKNTVIFNDEY